MMLKMYDAGLVSDGFVAFGTAGATSFLPTFSQPSKTTMLYQPWQVDSSNAVQGLGDAFSVNWDDVILYLAGKTSVSTTLGCITKIAASAVVDSRSVPSGGPIPINGALVTCSNAGAAGIAPSAEIIMLGLLQSPSNGSLKTRTM
jgi:hypothetical protein